MGTKNVRDSPVVSGYDYILVVERVPENSGTWLDPDFFWATRTRPYETKHKIWSKTYMIPDKISDFLESPPDPTQIDFLLSDLFDTRLFATRSTTTDHETNFHKSVFWLKNPCSIPGDFDSIFQLVQSISVFIFQSLLLLGFPLARPVRKTSQHENWKHFSPIEKVLSVTHRDEKYHFFVFF